MSMCVWTPRVIRAAREVVLTVTALLGVLCLMTAMAALVLDVRLLVFKSGSMQPSIGTGALGVAREVDATELRVGDAVGVRSRTGSHITHRVVSVSSHAHESAVLRLKGDANEDVDPEPYSVSTVDRLWFTIPAAGYALTWLASPVGTAFLGLYAGLLVLALFGRRRPGPPGPGRRRAAAPRRVGRRSRTRAVLTMTVAAVVAWAGPAEAAPWTDSVSVSAAISAHTVSPPDHVTCSGGGLLAPLTFSWPNKDLRYAYLVTLESGGSVRRTEWVVNNGVQGSTQSISYAFTLLNGLLGLPATMTVRVRSALSPTSTWISSQSATDTGELYSIVLVGLISSC